MSAVGPSERSRMITRAAYAPFAWTLAFIAFHVYWFMGGRFGLGDSPKPIPGPPSSVAGWILHFVVLAMFVAGVLVPLALVRPWGRNVPRWMLLTLAWIGSGVLSARGVAGIVDTLLRVTSVLPGGLTGLSNEQVFGQARPSAYILWSGSAIDAYFLLGGILFGVAAWMHTSHAWDAAKS
jgi:hypothetical protein